MSYDLSFKKVYTGELVQYDMITLHDFFLDYFNNYLSIDKFAEYNLLTRYEASKIIDMGRDAHEHMVKVAKSNNLNKAGV